MLKQTESQGHGFTFEFMFLDAIFENEKVKECLLKWKKHPKNYISIFDIPDFRYLKGFYDNILGEDIPITKKEYEENILSKGLTLPISIKSYKQTKNGKKKIEFGDLHRTIENFGFHNELERFSIICFEYQQHSATKTVKAVNFYNMDKTNSLLSVFKDDRIQKEIDETVDSVKSIERGYVPPRVKKRKREELRTILGKGENEFELEEGKNTKILEPRVKIDSKNQRRVQCTINKCFLEKHFKIEGSISQTLGGCFDGLAIESKPRKMKHAGQH